MTASEARKITFDVSEVRTFRHRTRARVRVLYGETPAADDTLPVDDAEARFDFCRKAIGALLLLFPDDAFPTAEVLHQRLLELIAEAEREATPGAESEGQPEERFAVNEQGGMVVQLWLADQPVSSPLVLTNFSAVILTSLERDDGAECRRLFEIEVVCRGQRSRVTLPAEEFDHLDWLGRVAGPEAIVVAGAGKRDKAREAIQRLSLGHTRQHKVFAHLGWRQIGGEHVYLHAGGAIGPAGALSEVDVQVPPALGRYWLPDPPADEPAAALRALFVALKRLPTVALLIVGCIVAAPLDPLLDGISSVLVLGSTGMRKSSLIAALLYLAGGGPWTAKTPPMTWESTANALEKLAHAAAAVAFWIDDIRPAATRREHEGTASATQRILREVVTRAGRQRLGPDITSRPVYYPRGPVVTSAELLPRGASTLARLLIAPMEAIEDEVLTELQTAGPERWPTIGAAWVRYIARNYDALAEALPAVFRHERTEAAGRVAGAHLGLPDSTAGLLAGWRTFLQFAVNCDVLDDVDADDWLGRMRDALDASIHYTHQALQVEKAETQWLDLVRQLLETGVLQVAGLPGYADNDSGLDAGWYDAQTEVVFLRASLVDREVRQLWRLLSQALPFPIEAARRGLATNGYLAHRGKREFTVTVRQPGRSKGGGVARVLALKAAPLVLHEEDALDA